MVSILEDELDHFAQRVPINHLTTIVASQVLDESYIYGLNKANYSLAKRTKKHKNPKGH